MLPEILTEIVREAGGDHLLLDARNGRGIISDAAQVEQVCRKLSNAGFTRLVNYTGMHLSLGGASVSACDSDSTPPQENNENGRHGSLPHQEQEQDQYSLYLTIRHPGHNHVGFTLKWKWQAGEAAHPSLSHIWQAAGLAEREMFEMLGIPFSGNTQLTPLFLDETFAGHPLRLDFNDTPELSYAEQLLKARHEQAMLDALGGASVPACESEPMASTEARPTGEGTQ